MRTFRDLPIQKKMLVMTLLICGAVLFVAIAALFTFQVLNFRFNFQRDTATLASISTSRDGRTRTIASEGYLRVGINKVAETIGVESS